MPSRSPLRPIFDPGVDYGTVNPGHMIGTPPIIPDYPALLNAVHWWDFSYAPNRTESAGPPVTVVSVADRIDSALMTSIPGSQIEVVTTLGTSGLVAGQADPGSGGAAERMTTSGLLLTSQPIWASWVGSMALPSNGSVWFDLKSTDPRPVAYVLTVGGWTIYAGSNVNGNTATSSAHIFYVEFNGASSKLYVDNVLVSSGNVGTAAAGPNASMFNIYAGGNGAVEIKIGELALGTGTNSGGDITDEYNRLLAKWI